MLTVVIILVVVAVVAAAIVFLVGPERIRYGRGPALKRRFGPEYERAVTAHNGDTKAAERELDERVKRHRDLKLRPLGPEAKARYTAQWSDIQQQFVDSPREALVAADALLSHLATDRGYPGDKFEEQISALSVHHGTHLEGYRSTHATVDGTAEGDDTEVMRKALVDARSLFEVLTSDKPAGSGRRTDRSAEGMAHSLWPLNRRQTKEPSA